MTGRTESGEIVTVDVLPEGSPAANPAFDVTPARLVTGADHRARRLRRQRSGPSRRSIPSSRRRRDRLSPAVRATVGLGFTQIVGWGTTFLMPSVLGRHIEHDLGLPSEVVYGGITVMFGVGALFAPRVGRLIDRTGARTLMASGLGALRPVARRARRLAGTRELSPVLGGDGRRLDPGAQHAGQHRARPGRGPPGAPGDRHAGHHRRLRLDRVLADLRRARTAASAGAARCWSMPRSICSSACRSICWCCPAARVAPCGSRRGRARRRPCRRPRAGASSCCWPLPSPAAPSSSPASSCTRSACCAASATTPPRRCCSPR